MENRNNYELQAELLKMAQQEMDELRYEVKKAEMTVCLYQTVVLVALLVHLVAEFLF